MKSSYSAYILAGGKSSRMQKDKATLVYKEHSFIKTIHLQFQSLDISSAIISSNIKHKKLNINTYKDQNNNLGPIGGLITAIEKSNTNWNIISSCDIPLLTKESIQWLIDNHDKNANATIAINKERKNPLFGIYHKNCKATIQKQIAKKDYKMIHLLNNLKVTYVETPNFVARELFNVNTPEDYKKL